MKGKKLSESLKEIRIALAINQEDMGKRLGMKLKMYSLYETGKYDKRPETDLNIKRLWKKIAELKQEMLADVIKSNPQKNDHLIAELKNEIDELKQENAILKDENRLLLKKLLSKSEKVIARGTQSPH